jgi:4-amino-4-deoxy-L-arabinose transferase-like glycosyltransferase
MRAAPAIVALTVLGVVLRLLVGHQDLFGDELSTHWIIAGHGLGGVVSTVHTDAEITPPLYFALAWLTTRIALTPELLRGPSLVAGAATIPLIYAIGLRTVGRRAALVATVLATLSPFLVYYSAEARGYALMVALLLGSTLSLLVALEDRRAPWWVLYGACTAGAAYSHYTCVFALGAQLAWVLWAHPEARRPALLANAGAVVAFLPWLGGLRSDLDSPTTKILSSLQHVDAGYLRQSIGHWAVGYPYASVDTRLRALPGTLALILLAAAAVLGLAGAWRWLRRLDRPAILVIALAVATPAGELVASALGSNLFGTRNLAAAWPATALCVAAMLVAAGPRLGLVASGLAIVAFAIGSATLLGDRFQRPHYEDVATYLDGAAAPADVVVDGSGLSPAGVPTALDLDLRRPHRRVQLGKANVVYDPFRILSLAPPTPELVRQAAGAARGHRLFFVLFHGTPQSREAVAALPPGWRRKSSRRFAGLDQLEVSVYTATGA